MGLPIIVDLPQVKASGRREGWWFHVKGLASAKAKGLRQFDGLRLAPGTCELPAMSVLILLRPVGPAKSDKRSADVMYVSSAGVLKGVDYGLPWGDPAGDTALRESVTKALVRQASFVELESRLAAATSGFVGGENTPANRDRITKDLTSILCDVIPLAAVPHLGVTPGGDAIELSFTLPAKDCVRIIRCAVPVYNGAGDPDFYFVAVRVPFAYENVDEDLDSDAPHHHAAARKSALAQGYDSVTIHTPVFDDTEGRWNALLDLFEWDTALLVDLVGETMVNQEGDPQ